MNNTSNTPGLNCPVCQFNIKFTIQDLLVKKSIDCPSCGLHMEMNVPAEPPEKWRNTLDRFRGLR